MKFNKPHKPWVPELRGELVIGSNKVIMIVTGDIYDITLLSQSTLLFLILVLFNFEDVDHGV